MSKLLDLVDTQAEDEGLWFDAKTAPEAYLQKHLRELHQMVESMLAPDNVVVNKRALLDVLVALNGPEHHIRELQATRNIPFGDANPIDVLIDNLDD